MYRRFLIAFISVAAVAGQAGAQSPAPAAPSLLSAPALAELQGARRASSRSIVRHSLHAVGGAFLGAGIGYFTSHVVYNDWDKTSNSRYAQQRKTYSLSGAAVGAIAGLLVGRGQPEGSGPASVSPVGRRSGEVETISHTEITSSSAKNAFEAVQLLRPNWLVVRGVKNFTETGRLSGSEREMTSTAGMPQIRAYLNYASLGEVSELRQVPLVEVQSIQFLSPAQATLRFGGGNAHGAIVVSTATN